MKILGIRIDNYSKDKILGSISGTISGSSPGRKFITTLNPEIILKARSNAKYKQILNSADFNICDGFGIKLVSFLKRNKIKVRITGADLADYILRKAREYGSRVLVIVSENSLSEPGEIKNSIKIKYKISVDVEYLRANQVIKEIAAKEAEIVFVNFGAPQQENFIFKNKNNFPKAKILIGVGGAFDFITGKIMRAPKILRRMGLEWLWRLFLEPKRLRRITNAVFVFPIIALINPE